MTPTFKGEVMLAGWGETHNGGAKVTFWLPDPSDLDAFKSLTIAKGKTAGHRFMAVLVEIGEDELPKEPEKPKEKLKGGELSKLAGMFCGDPAFCEWLRNEQAIEWSGSLGKGLPESEIAARVIRYCCGIESRAELDHDDAAAIEFHRRFRIPWSKHNAK